MSETRNILLVGRTGQGKSSLANLLVNKNGNFEEVFKAGSRSTSITKNVQTETFREGNIIYQIIDTIGFSDTELVGKDPEDEEKLFYKLAQIASEVEGGINQILFVSDGRFTEEEVKILGGLRGVVFDEEMVNFLTIVRTRFPEFEDPKKCEEDYKSLTNEELINKNKIGSRLVKAIGKEKFIHVDNLPIRGSENAKAIAIEVKQAARSKLLNHLINARISYEPENLVKLKKRIKDSGDSIEKEKKEIQEKIENVKKELTELKGKENLNETERSKRKAEHEKQLNDLVSRSSKLEEEKRSNTKSVAFSLFEENINMIIKSSEAGARIGKDALWGVGAPAGGVLGFATGVGGALLNSGVNLVEEGINFLTGNKEDKLRKQLDNLQSTNSQLSTDLRQQITTLQREKANLQSQVSQLQRDNSTLTQQNKDKDKTISERDKTIQNNQTEIARLKREKSQLETDKISLNTTITSLNQQVQSLQNALSGGPQGTAVIQTPNIPNIPPQGGNS